MGLISTDKQLPKSMAKICILDILSDASRDHPLEQSDILARLVRKYGIGINRKTLHSHLSELVEAIDAIHYEEVDRTINGEVSPMMTNFWMEEESLFDDTEISALIYSVLFSRHIYAKDKSDLIERLESLSGFKLHYDMKNYLINETRKRSESNQLFWNLEALSEAIQNKKYVSFKLSAFDANGKQVTPNDRHVVLPLGIACGSGDYYLIAYDRGTESEGTNLGFGNRRQQPIRLGDVKGHEPKKAGGYYLSSYRLDRMKDVKSIESADWEESFDTGDDWFEKCGFETVLPDIDFDVMDYFKKNPRLLEGNEAKAVLAVSKDAPDVVANLFDYFGASNVKRYKADNSLSETWIDHLGERPTFQVGTNINMLFEFVLVNCKHVEIVSPYTLKHRFQKLILEAFSREADFVTDRMAVEKYGSSEEADKALGPILSRLEEALEDLVSALLPEGAEKSDLLE